MSTRRLRARLRASILSSVALLLLLPAWLSLVFSSYAAPPQPLPPPLPLAASPDAPLSLQHLVFGIASSSGLWASRRRLLRLWWRPHMRGSVWLDDRPPASSSPDGGEPNLPPIRFSEDIGRFRYTNPTGHPSGLRIARVVAESFRLGHGDVRWFVLCDDDSVMSPENLVAVLSKYEWREMVYVGVPSESHSANTYFSHNMAFGGAGIAVSYPLARALADMQDGCLERYPKLYGSDDRLHACVSELGVPLTREPGFHQCDIRGNAHGLLAGHPVAPFVSIHHVEAMDPIYPGSTSLQGLQLFARAMAAEERAFLQRSICYNHHSRLTFAVSVGYVVQVFPDVVLPRELERSEKTYVAWNWRGGRDEFDLDTRDANVSPCKRPSLFYLREVRRDRGNGTASSYVRSAAQDKLKTKALCFPRPLPMPQVKEIRVLRRPLSHNWHLVPRRLCCQVDKEVNGTLEIIVGQCGKLNLRSVLGFL